jgi:hypothetical protein
VRFLFFLSSIACAIESSQSFWDAQSSLDE